MPITFVAQDVLILALVIALGFSIGQLPIAGIRLGIAGVLFAGILLGHFGFNISAEVLHFIKDFGLILFVYSIGMHVGPGFFSSLKRHGLRLNALAAGIVLMGVLITIGLIFLAGIPVPAAVGLFSGATTNTPSLGAAQEALRSLELTDSTLQHMPGMAYAMAYPFGIIGIILNMILVRALFKIDPAVEAQRYQKDQSAGNSHLTAVNLEVNNENLAGVMLKDIPLLHGGEVVVSRIMHHEEIRVAQPESVLSQGDIIHAVGTQPKLRELKMLVGSVTAIDLKSDVESEITARWMVLSRKAMVGKTIAELSLSSISEVTVTRIIRAGIEFAATAQMELQYGDDILVVGSESALKRLAEALGDSRQELGMPQLQPFFLGILLGIVVGSIPLPIPGVPVPVKLGLAGGPLLVAICLSRVGHIGRMIWYVPESANHMIREFGITLFLACVGLSSGKNFVATITQGDGFYWMLCATLITFVPLVVTAFCARKLLGLNYLSLNGLLAGSMTDPPALAFANAMAKSTATSVAYATVYPLVMILRVVAAQVLVIVFMS